MEIVTFRKIVTTDPTDMLYDDGTTWSRIYEYPLVLAEMQKHHPEGKLVHNSSWGFAGVHITFKEKVDSIYQNVHHSDIRASDLPGTHVYDITRPPAADEIEKYDFVINISTLEEVDADHWACFNNLYSQVKPGGLFVATFDLPGLQIKTFEKQFGQKLAVDGTALNGKNSALVNKKYKRLNCGVMTLRKT